MVDKRTKGLRKQKGGVTVAGDSRVPVEFADGETRFIKYTMRAIGTLENCYPERDAEGKYTGNPATPIGAILRWTNPETGMAWSLLENFLWVGLLYDNPDLTKDDIEDWIEPAKVAYYDERIGTAIKLALGAGEVKVGEDEAVEDDVKNEESTGMS
jgi:hypothetical protein